MYMYKIMKRIYIESELEVIFLRLATNYQGNNFYKLPVMIKILSPGVFLPLTQGSIHV